MAVNAMLQKHPALKKTSMIKLTWEVNRVVQASNVEHNDRKEGTVKKTPPWSTLPECFVIWGNEQPTGEHQCPDGMLIWFCKWMNTW